MKNRIALTALAAALLGIGTAYAQAPHGPDAMFKALDSNHDGQLSMNELKQMPQLIKNRRFERADLNHDGKIDKSEFMAAAVLKAERMFTLLDRNGDGVIEPNEAIAMQHWQRREHRNHAHHWSHRPNAGPDQDHDKAGGRHSDDRRHDGYGATAGHHLQKLMTRMDSNGDGQISQAEWDQAMATFHHRDPAKGTAKPSSPSQNQ